MIPSDQLYNYLHFMDEKLRLRQVKYLVNRLWEPADLKACTLLFCQGSHVPAGMDAGLGKVFPGPLQNEK